jgi:hypothetical protein
MFLTAKSAENTKRSLSISAISEFFAVTDFGCGVSRAAFFRGYHCLVPVVFRLELAEASP